jgi:hypothetical protein
MATGNDMNEHVSKAYHAFLRDGSVAALGREALKDARNTIMEIFFGKGERGGEPGTPFNPLFYDIVAGRNAHASVFGDGPDDMKGTSSMNNDPNSPTPSITAAILGDPHAFMTPQGQGHENVMGHDTGNVGPDAGQVSPGQTPSITEAILDNPQRFLPPDQQNGQEHQQQHDHGREI